MHRTLAPAGWWLVLGLAFAAVAMAAPAGDARADGDAAALQPEGYDISWPQCGKPYPAGPVAFAIIGINGGRPYTPNPCFVDQYRWAQRFERNPAVYLNTDYPKSDFAAADTGPAGTCAEGDGLCRAYNYGYGFASEAAARAAALRITPGMWWLDVETANYWSDEPSYNARVIRGAVDFLVASKLPVGVYGTPRQWRIIAGTYAPGLPVWDAGAENRDDAASRCNDRSFAFAGGTVRMVQYYGQFDLNFRCSDLGAPQPARPASLPTKPADPSAPPGPARRSLSPSGQQLPYWHVVPLLAN